MTSDNSDSSITSSSHSLSLNDIPLDEIESNLVILYEELKNSIKTATVRDVRQITISKGEDLNEADNFLRRQYENVNLELIGGSTEIRLAFPLIGWKQIEEINAMRIEGVKKLLFFEHDCFAIRLSCVEFRDSIANYNYSDVRNVNFCQLDYINGKKQLDIMSRILKEYLEKEDQINFFKDQDTILVAFTIGIPKTYNSLRDVRYAYHNQLDSLHGDFEGHNLVEDFQQLFDSLNYMKSFRIVTAIGVGSSDIIAMQAFNGPSSNYQHNQKVVDAIYSCYYGVFLGIFKDICETRKCISYDFGNFGRYYYRIEWERIENMIQDYERDIFDGSFLDRHQVFAYLSSPGHLLDMLDFFLLKLMMIEGIQPVKPKFRIGFKEYDAFSKGNDILKIFTATDFDVIRDRVINYIGFLTQRACILASMAFLAGTEQSFYKDIEPRFDIGVTPEVNILIRDSYYQKSKAFHEKLKFTLSDLVPKFWTERRKDYERPIFNFIRHKDAEVIGTCLWTLYQSTRI